jgi:hypothetical protein
LCVLAYINLFDRVRETVYWLDCAILGEDHISEIGVKTLRLYLSETASKVRFRGRFVLLDMKDMREASFNAENVMLCGDV